MYVCTYVHAWLAVWCYKVVQETCERCSFSFRFPSQPPISFTCVVQAESEEVQAGCSVTISLWLSSLVFNIQHMYIKIYQLHPDIVKSWSISRFLAGRGISDSSTCNCQLFVLDQQQTGFILILAVVSLALCFEFLEPPQADPLENLMGMNGGLNFDVKWHSKTLYDHNLWNAKMPTKCQQNANNTSGSLEQNTSLGCFDRLWTARSPHGAARAAANAAGHCINMHKL